MTDVFEDDAVWVRDGEAMYVRDIRDTDEIVEAPTSFDGLRDWFRQDEDREGVLFVHPDGRAAVVTRQDFGL